MKWTSIKETEHYEDTAENGGILFRFINFIHKSTNHIFLHYGQKAQGVNLLIVMCSVSGYMSVVFIERLIRSFLFGIIYTNANK